MPVPTVLLAYLSLTHPAILAQAATEAGSWLTALNLGLAGIGLYMFASGKLVAQSTYQRCEDKLAQVEEELRERNKEARETLIPALTRATDLLARHIERQFDNTPPPPTRPPARP